MGKGVSQINQTIKKEASETLPIGEELASALSDSENDRPIIGIVTTPSDYPA